MKNDDVFKRAVNRIDAYIRQEKLHFEKKEGGRQTIYSGSFGGFEGVYTTFQLRVLVDPSHVSSLMYLPAYASNKTAQMAEFITRANYALVLGKFEMDFSDGEVRFQYAQPSSALADDRSDESLKAIFYLPPSMMKRYAPSMGLLLQGVKATPEALVKECESKARQESAGR